MFETIVPRDGRELVFRPECSLEPLEFQLKSEQYIKHKLGEFGATPDLFNPFFNKFGVYARDEFGVHHYDWSDVG